MTHPLRLATLLPTPVSVRAGQLNPMWRARAITEDGAIVAVYLKQLGAAALLAEVLGTLLARACKLGTPAPLLIADPQLLLSSPGALPLFGLEDANHQSMRQWIEQGEDAGIQEALMAWPNLRPCCVLDEAIANIDRHPGNLLWDGEEAFIPIDHDFALGGPLRHPMRPVRHNETVRNLLADRLYNHFGQQIEAVRLEKAAREVAESLQGIDLVSMLPQTLGQKMQVMNWLDDVIGLLQKRIDLAEALMRQRARNFQQTPLSLPEP